MQTRQNSENELTAIEKTQKNLNEIAQLQQTNREYSEIIQLNNEKINRGESLLQELESLNIEKNKLTAEQTSLYRSLISNQGQHAESLRMSIYELSNAISMMSSKIHLYNNELLIIQSLVGDNQNIKKTIALNNEIINAKIAETENLVIHANHSILHSINNSNNTIDLTEDVSTPINILDSIPFDSTNNAAETVPQPASPYVSNMSVDNSNIRLEDMPLIKIHELIRSRTIYPTKSSLLQHLNTSSDYFAKHLAKYIYLDDKSHRYKKLNYSDLREMTSHKARIKFKDNYNKVFGNNELIYCPDTTINSNTNPIAENAFNNSPGYSQDLSLNAAYFESNNQLHNNNNNNNNNNDFTTQFDNSPISILDYTEYNNQHVTDMITTSDVSAYSNLRGSQYLSTSISPASVNPTVYSQTTIDLTDENIPSTNRNLDNNIIYPLNHSVLFQAHSSNINNNNEDLTHQFKK